MHLRVEGNAAADRSMRPDEDTCLRRWPLPGDDDETSAILELVQKILRRNRRRTVEENHVVGTALGVTVDQTTGHDLDIGRPDFRQIRGCGRGERFVGLKRHHRFGEASQNGRGIAHADTDIENAVVLLHVSQLGELREGARLHHVASGALPLIESNVLVDYGFGSEKSFKAVVDKMSEGFKLETTRSMRDAVKK